MKFSAEGFAGGEQYEIHIVAYPKENITNVEPIPSNRRVDFYTIDHKKILSSFI